MPKTKCPHCQSQFGLKNESLLGQVRPCAKCGKKFRIEDADEIDDADEYEEPVAPVRSKKGSNKKVSKGRKSSSLGLYLGVGGGLLAVGLVIFGAMTFLKNRDAARGGPEDAVADTAGIDPASQQVTQGLDLQANSKAIGLACHNHSDQYRTLPHPELTPDGKPALSWRVRILEQMDQQHRELYSQFHLNEPWDSDHNKTLIGKMPAIYATPGVTESGKTAWHMFTGPASPFEKGPIRLHDITDGVSNSLMCIMGGPESATEWTKPGGIELQTASPLLPLGTPHEGTFPVVMFDGLALKLKPQTPAAEVVALIRVNDGIYIVGDLFDNYGPPQNGTGLRADYPGLGVMNRVFDSFKEEHGKYPPASTPGGLSWRVAILPKIGQQELYDQFHHNEPWDSAHNKTLLAKMPKAFQTPGITASGMTSLHVIAGPDTPFGVPDGVQERDLYGDKLDVLMVLVAGPEVASEWTRPGGLPFVPANPCSAWGSPQGGGIYPVAVFDGSLRALRADASPTMLALFVQYKDGQPIDPAIFTKP